MGSVFDEELVCQLDGSLESSLDSQGENDVGQPGLFTTRVTATYPYFLVYGLGGPL